MSPEESVLTQLRIQNDIRRRAWPRFLASFAVMTILGLLALAFKIDWRILLPVQTLAIFGVVYFTIACFTLTSRHKAAAENAIGLGDKRAAGYLLEILDSDEEELKPVARAALLKHLQAIGPEDADLFDAGHRQSMQVAVNFSKDTELVAAILGALRQIGGTEAIAPLEIIAEGGPMNGDPQHREKVQELARLALTDTRMRLARTAITGRAGHEQATLDTLRTVQLGEQ